MTVLDDAEGLKWLTDTLGIPTEGYAVAVIFGNDDAPERVEVYPVNDYRSVPTVYVADEWGILTIQEGI